MNRRMKQRKVHFIDGIDGDWTQFYVDGELKYEGHSIPRWAIFEGIGLEYTEEEKDFEGAE